MVALLWHPLAQALLGLGDWEELDDLSVSSVLNVQLKSEVGGVVYIYIYIIYIYIYGYGNPPPPQ